MGLRDACGISERRLWGLVSRLCPAGEDRSVLYRGLWLDGAVWWRWLDATPRAPVPSARLPSTELCSVPAAPPGRFCCQRACLPGAVTTGAQTTYLDRGRAALLQWRAGDGCDASGRGPATDVSQMRRRVSASGRRPLVGCRDDARFSRCFIASSLAPIQCLHYLSYLGNAIAPGAHTAVFILILLCVNRDGSSARGEINRVCMTDCCFGFRCIDHMIDEWTRCYM